jgi:hypothetical protein
MPSPYTRKLLLKAKMINLRKVYFKEAGKWDNLSDEPIEKWRYRFLIYYCMKIDSYRLPKPFIFR